MVIAGQSRHVSYSHLYLKGALGAFYVFDLTRKDSLLQLQDRWQPQVLRVSPKSLSIIIGNKADLKSDRKLTKTEMKRILQAMNALDYIETSAKTGKNVNEAFHTMAAKILNIKIKEFL